ncbi:MAG: hypothetical protein JWO14_2369 [Solirubrobacterales bacterium]|nr:hypothetical protein [Solirubrobacterales bacterium]
MSSTSEFPAIDPLGGSLGSYAHIRAEAEAHEAARSWLKRKLMVIVDWATYDEPNLTDGEITLSVDEGADEPLSPQEESDIAATVKALHGVGPVKSRFYDELLSEPDPDASSIR